ncbi:GNAT family N-acetyltransferase [Kitasatospora albolonga]
MPTLVPPTVPAGSLAARPQPELDGGDGLFLRPWQPGDAPAVLTAYQDPEIQRWHVRRADSLAEAEGWIADWRGGWATETEAHWAVVDAGGGLLGRAALKGLALPTARPRSPTGSSRRPGAGASARARWRRWPTGPSPPQASPGSNSPTPSATPPPAGWAVKTGFILEGTRRSAWPQADGRHDAHLHARLRTD